MDPQIAVQEQGSMLPRSGPELAREMFVEALATAEEIGNEQSIVSALANCATLDVDQGRDTEAEDKFSFEKKNAMDSANPKVQEWEQLMWKYQQALPIAKTGEKWILMDKIFQTCR